MRTMHPVLPALAVAVLVAACGSGDNSAEAREKQLEEYARQYGVDADVELDEDSQVTIQQGVAGGSVTTGQDLEVPDDFPRDVAIYPGMKILSSAVAPGGYMLQGQAAASGEAVAGFFRSEMARQGWRDESPQASAGLPMTSLRFVKDQRATGVNLIPDGDRVTMQIMITPSG